MQSRTALILALILSAALHLGVVVFSGLRLPEEIENDPIRIEARLLQAPNTSASLAKAKVPRQPKPKALETPVPEAPVVGLPPSSTPEPAPDPIATSQSEPLTTPVEMAGNGKASEALPTDQPIAAAPPKAIADWPMQGCIKYAVNAQYGILRGEFGQAEHCWEHDESRYFATMRLKAAVAWRQYQLEQESTGHIAGGILLSDLFREKIDSNKNYETLFDIAAKKVKQNRNGETREVVTDGVGLDTVALLHFMAMQPEEMEAFDMFVVASRGTVSRVTVMQRPAQPLTLPTGETIARQFHAETRQGELKIDVWIAKSLRNAPVRFRIDNKGDIVDFQAVDVTLDGINLARKPQPPPPPPPSISE